MTAVTCFCGASFASVDLLYHHAMNQGHVIKCGCGTLFKGLGQMKHHQSATNHYASTEHTEHPELKNYNVDATAAADAGTTPLKCVFCPSKDAFKDAASLKQHMFDKHPTCPTCKETFLGDTASKKLFGHQKAANHCYCHEHDCNFRNSAALANHKRNETHVTGFGCIDCKRDFETEQALDRHIEVCRAQTKQNVGEEERAKAAFTAAEEQKLRCEACKKDFKDLKGFRQHKASVKHNPLSDITCFLSESLTTTEKTTLMQRIQCCASLAFTSDPPAGTSTCAELFEYKSLGPGEFRLLRLHEGDADDPIHCSLFVDKISSPPSYEALSYTWGDPFPLHDISLSNEDEIGNFTLPRRYSARTTLYSALTRMRMKERPSIFWIDALCINQDDNEERANQVQLMGKIFEQAHRVIVWLGEGTVASDLALSKLPALFRQHQLLQADGNTDSQRNVSAISLAKAYLDLCSHPWFGRVWVLQELALSRQATFICGTKQIDFEDFRTALDLISQSLESRDSELTESHRGSSVSIDTSALDRARLLFDIGAKAVKWCGGSRASEMSHLGFSLLELALRTSHLGATDPRDKVYGLLGLAGQAQSRRASQQVQCLRPDYNKSTIEVFHNFIEHSISSTQSLDIILQPWAPLIRPKTDARRMRLRDSDIIPSWISLSEDLPFGEPSKAQTCSCSSTRRLNGDCLVSLKAQYSASKGLIAEVQFGPLVRKANRQSVNAASMAQAAIVGLQPDVGETTDACPIGRTPNPVLHADGIELGTVTDLSSRMADGMIPRDCLEMGGMSFTDGCGAMRATSPRIWQRLWQTLVADRDASGGPAPSTFGFAFFSIFKEVLRCRSLDTIEMLEDHPNENIAQFLKRVRDITWNRRMFRSAINNYDENFLGLAPRQTLVSDKIVILLGCTVPVILRPNVAAGDGYCRIVGPAFVHGKMEGEALSAFDDVTMDWMIRTFQIV